MYTKTTHNIQVSVEVVFLEEQSKPHAHYFMWAYRVRIENRRETEVKLTSRHWQITDALGRTQEVYGDGVVGQTPMLKPNEVFEYTSGTPLETSSGIMVGSYLMQTHEGEEISVEIPAFSLDSPYNQASIH